MCLKYVRKFSDDERSLQLKSTITNDVVHTNNCPTQYKYRKVFWHIAVGSEDNGWRITHRFSQKYGFKGSWDATGKQIKTLILQNKKSSLRCANALDCYLRLTRDLENMGHDIKQ